VETKLKEHLSLITDQLTPESTLEDVYEQLSLLSDIEMSEKDEIENQVFTQSVVRNKVDEWLK